MGLLVLVVVTIGCRGREPVVDPGEGEGEGEGEPETCGATQVRCTSGCASLRNDVDNCGFCNLACSSQDRCVDGLCVGSCAAPGLAAPLEEVVLVDDRLQIVATGRDANGRLLAVLRDGGVLDAASDPPTISPPATLPTLVFGVRDVDPTPGDEVVAFAAGTVRAFSFDGSLIVDTGVGQGDFIDLDDDGTSELMTVDGLYVREGNAFVRSPEFPAGLGQGPRGNFNLDRRCLAHFDVDDDGDAELISLGPSGWWRVEQGAWIQHLWAEGRVAAVCELLLDVDEERLRFVGGANLSILEVTRRNGTLALSPRLRSVNPSFDGTSSELAVLSPYTAWFTEGTRRGFVVGVGVTDPVGSALVAGCAANADGTPCPRELVRRALEEPAPLRLVDGDGNQLTFSEFDVVVDGIVPERGSLFFGGVTFAGLPVAVADDGPFMMGSDLFDSSRAFLRANSTLARTRLPIGPGTSRGSATVADVDGDGLLDVIFVPTFTSGFDAPATVFKASGEVAVVDVPVFGCNFNETGDLTLVGVIDGRAGTGRIEAGAFVVDVDLGPAINARRGCADLDGDGDLDLQGVRNEDGVLVSDSGFVGDVDLDQDGVLERLTCDSEKRCALVSGTLSLPLPVATFSVRLGPGQSLLVDTGVFTTVLPLQCGP
ncbi:MAG: hypothetical protein Q8O67_06585 [Deltaproteobacteria bacterium]|nr:hypothetical protein [Deltaproteobacteria bacterium]